MNAFLSSNNGRIDYRHSQIVLITGHRMDLSVAGKDGEAKDAL